MESTDFKPINKSSWECRTISLLNIDIHPIYMRIHTNRLHNTKYFDFLKASGYYEPIVVVRRKSHRGIRYLIIDGLQRVYAFKSLGLWTIEAYVLPVCTLEEELHLFATLHYNTYANNSLKIELCSVIKYGYRYVKALRNERSKPTNKKLLITKHKVLRLRTIDPDMQVLGLLSVQGIQARLTKWINSFKGQGILGRAIAKFLVDYIGHNDLIPEGWLDLNDVSLLQLSRHRLGYTGTDYEFALAYMKFGGLSCGYSYVYGSPSYEDDVFDGWLNALVERMSFKGIYRPATRVLVFIDAYHYQEDDVSLARLISRFTAIGFSVCLSLAIDVACPLRADAAWYVTGKDHRKFVNSGTSHMYRLYGYGVLSNGYSNDILMLGTSIKKGNHITYRSEKLAQLVLVSAFGASFDVLIDYYPVCNALLNVALSMGITYVGISNNLDLPQDRDVADKWAYVDI